MKLKTNVNMREDNGAHSLYKRCFSCSCREDAHRIPPRGPGGYHAARPQCPFTSAASDTAELHRWRIVFLALNDKPPCSSFPKAFVRYTISSDSRLVIMEGNIMLFFLLFLSVQLKRSLLFGRFISAFKCFGHICWSLSYQALVCSGAIRCIDTGSQISNGSHYYLTPQ